MGKLEIKVPENLLVYDKEYSIDFVRRTIKNESLNGLRIFDHLDPLPSLDFLKDYTFLTHLSISCIDDHDYSFLNQLTNLKSLFIGSSVTTRHEIDLSHQTNLTYLGITWRKHIKGLENCQKIERLLLIEFKEKDLSWIRPLSALKDLSIKTATIKHLGGIEGCKGLESILLGNCRQLTSISALNHLCNLKKIELDLVTQVKDYEKLSDLPALSKLKIIDCKKISSISFIRNLPSLRTLMLIGNTEIEDGDLTPATALEEVFYPNRRHYNVKYPPPNLI